MVVCGSSNGGMSTIVRRFLERYARVQRCPCAAPPVCSARRPSQCPPNRQSPCNRQDKPKPTVALEYTFGRYAKGHDRVRDATVPTHPPKSRLFRLKSHAHAARAAQGHCAHLGAGRRSQPRKPARHAHQSRLAPVRHHPVGAMRKRCAQRRRFCRLRDMP